MGNDTTVPAHIGLLDGYLKPYELAAELGICEETLKRWHAARIGPPRVRVGRRILYRRSAVESWLRAREEAADNDGRRGRGRPRGSVQQRAVA